MIKYRKVREKVQAHHVNNQYVKFTVSPLATRDELITTHCPNYVDRYLKGQLTEKENRKIGFPWSLNSVNRTLSSVGGTIGAMRDVMNRYKPNQSIAACHIAGIDRLISINISNNDITMIT
jgi:acetoin utilization deacetylase AcuC-like enzyme